MTQQIFGLHRIFPLWDFPENCLIKGYVQPLKYLKHHEREYILYINEIRDKYLY